jgi:DNA modification methylase
MNEEKDIWFWETDLPRTNSFYYTKESIMHPAKMHIMMCREIIKRYSEKGEWILDPMAGIGTTLVEGLILGRNVIGIELEKWFTNQICQNIQNVFKNRLMNVKTSAVVINGDSTKASELLNNEQVEKILFSPPYGHESYVTEGDTKPVSTFSVAFKNMTSYNADSMTDFQKWFNREVGHAKSQPYNVDKIITSPKGGDVIPFQDMEWARKNIPRKVISGSIMKYDVDRIIFSPPFESSLAGGENDNLEKFKHGSAGKTYTKDKSSKNIGLMKDAEYRWFMLKVYNELFKILKDGGIMALVTKNHVENGRQVPLDEITINLCINAGFKFFARHYRKLPNTSFWLNDYRKKWNDKHPNKPCPIAEFEDILVFKKGEHA